MVRVEIVLMVKDTLRPDPDVQPFGGRIYSLPVVPRIDEILGHKNMKYQVLQVEHTLDPVRLGCETVTLLVKPA